MSQISKISLRFVPGKTVSVSLSVAQSCARAWSWAACARWWSRTVRVLAAELGTKSTSLLKI